MNRRRGGNTLAELAYQTLGICQSRFESCPIHCGDCKTTDWTKTMATANEKRGLIYIRILCVIDALAPVRAGMSVAEITQRASDMAGEKFSKRTIHRDLKSLKQVGYVREVEKRSFGRGSSPAMWSLNLDRSRYVQAAAVSTLDYEVA